MKVDAMLMVIVPIGIFFQGYPLLLVMTLFFVTFYAIGIAYKFLNFASKALKWNEKLL